MDKESSLNWKEMKKDDIFGTSGKKAKRIKTMDTSYTMNNSSSLVFKLCLIV